MIFPADAPRIDSDAVRSASEGDEGTLFADDDRALFTARIATRTPVAASISCTNSPCTAKASTTSISRAESAL